MGPTLKQSVLGILALVMLLLAIVTLIAMVIALPCTGIMPKADTYKIVSVFAFLSAFYLFAWRKRSLIAGILIPCVQIGSGFLFMTYLNSLPVSCPG